MVGTELNRNDSLTINSVYIILLTIDKNSVKLWWNGASLGIHLFQLNIDSIYNVRITGIGTSKFDLVKYRNLVEWDQCVSCLVAVHVVESIRC